MARERDGPPGLPSARAGTAARDKPRAVVLTEERLAELRARCAWLVRRAVLTIHAWPDRERGWLAGPRSSMPEIIRALETDRGFNADYDNEAARDKVRPRFEPTPADYDRCLEVLSWLAWLERQHGGGRDVKILVARAHDMPMWKLAERFGRSDDTIRRWEAGAIAMLTFKFWRAIDRM